MTKVLLVGQDKGGTGKTLVSRGLCEILPGAPVFEIDASPRMIELGKRVQFFQMRADRDEIERTGGAVSRSEFDPVINAIASATLPTVVDVGANNGASLLAVIDGLTDDFSAAGVEFGLLVAHGGKFLVGLAGEMAGKKGRFAGGPGGQTNPQRRRAEEMLQVVRRPKLEKPVWAATPQVRRHVYATVYFRWRTSKIRQITK
jgi:hypothetical protein